MRDSERIDYLAQTQQEKTLDTEAIQTSKEYLASIRDRAYRGGTSAPLNFEKEFTKVLDVLWDAAQRDDIEYEEIFESLTAIITRMDRGNKKETKFTTKIREHILKVYESSAQRMHDHIAQASPEAQFYSFCAMSQLMKHGDSAQKQRGSELLNQHAVLLQEQFSGNYMSYHHGAIAAVIDSDDDVISKRMEDLLKDAVVQGKLKGDTNVGNFFEIWCRPEYHSKGQPSERMKEVARSVTEGFIEAKGLDFAELYAETVEQLTIISHFSPSLHLSEEVQ